MIPINIYDARDKYLSHMIYRYGASKDTMTTYSSITKEFVALIEVQETTQLNLEIVDNYANILCLRNLAPRTVKNKLAVVRAFVKYLHSRGHTNLKHDQIETPKTKDGEPNYLTENELDAFLTAVKHPRDFALITCIVISGLRVSEASNLYISDLYGRAIMIRHGKGDKFRPAYLTQQASDVVTAYIHNTRGNMPGVLFKNPDGQPLSRQIIARKVKYYAEVAGIEKHVTPHTLRHTYATLLANQGIDINILRILLGHSSIRTTQHYVHSADSFVESVYNQKMTYVFRPNKLIKARSVLT